MQICSASVDDARAIAEIHVTTWQVAYADIIPAQFLDGLSVKQREAYWRDEIPLGNQKIAIAKEDSQVLGWISYGASRDKDAGPSAAEIWAVYVSPEHWSSGVGRQLWLHAQAHLARQGYRSVSLWVLADNFRAIDFYLKAGLSPDPSGKEEFEIGGIQLQEIRYVAELPGLDNTTACVNSASC